MDEGTEYNPSLSLDDVTDEILDFVENEVAMGSGAWDCVPPKEIILAAWKIKPESKNGA